MKPSRNILFTFGINGSLRKREVQAQASNTEYYLFNSAANLKAYSNNLTEFAYYGYNAANTSTYKLSMLNMNQWVNGQPFPLHFSFGEVFLRSAKSALTIGKRSAPLPCYGRRIFCIGTEIPMM